MPQLLSGKKKTFISLFIHQINILHSTLLNGVKKLSSNALIIWEGLKCKSDKHNSFIYSSTDFPSIHGFVYQLFQYIPYKTMSEKIVLEEYNSWLFSHHPILHIVRCFLHSATGNIVFHLHGTSLQILHPE